MPQFAPGRPFEVDPRRCNLVTSRNNDREAMSKRAFNLPNMLTYARILAVPLIVLCFYLEGRVRPTDWWRWAAVTIFIVDPGG